MKRRYKTAAGLLAGLLLCQNVYGASLKEPEIQAQAAVVMQYMAWRKAAAIHCSWNRETS